MIERIRNLIKLDRKKGASVSQSANLLLQKEAITRRNFNNNVHLPTVLSPVDMEIFKGHYDSILTK